jgi:hypothetical protein
MYATAEEKANFYIQRNKGNLDLAFKDAEYEEYDVLKILFKRGANINFDVGQNINMLGWAAAGPRKRNSDFIKFLIDHGRTDMKDQIARVLDLAIHWRHMNIVEMIVTHEIENNEFGLLDTDVKKQKIMKKCISSGQYKILHQLLLYGFDPHFDNDILLMHSFCSFGGDIKTTNYLITCLGFKIEINHVIQSAKQAWYEIFAHIFNIYLDTCGKKYKILKNTSDQILSLTAGINKIELLVNMGFDVEDYDNIIELYKQKNLPKDSLTRCIEIINIDAYLNKFEKEKEQINNENKVKKTIDNENMRFNLIKIIINNENESIKIEFFENILPIYDDIYDKYGNIIQ